MEKVSAAFDRQEAGLSVPELFGQGTFEVIDECFQCGASVPRHTHKCRRCKRDE